jgi:hypothetical protein
MSAWPDEIKYVYLLCNPEKERARFERVVPHILIQGVPKDRLRVCAPTWSDTLPTDLMMKVYDPYLRRGPVPTFSFKSARLSKGEVSLVLNFYAAIQSALKDLSGNESILVLESDVFLRRDFVPRLDALMKDVSGQTWDYISLSEGVGTRPPKAPKSYYSESKGYDPPHMWVFRCTDSMILNRRFLENISKTLIPFKECLDWELNFQIALHGGKALWADPPLVEQGTCYNRIASSLT